MTILTVDCNLDQLKICELMLRRIFPQDAVVAYQDPLMAGKYCCNNRVDIVFAALNMERMDGLKMAEFAHHFHPEAQVYLTADPEYCQWESLYEDKINGMIPYPLSEESIRAVLERAETEKEAGPAQPK